MPMPSGPNGRPVGFGFGRYQIAVAQFLPFDVRIGFSVVFGVFFDYLRILEVKTVFAVIEIVRFFITDWKTKF